MDCKVRNVDLSIIRHQDHTFKISTRPLQNTLVDSIEHIGLINRPLLLEDNSGYLIVSGFARLAACIRLGWSRVNAVCLPADTPRRLCALAAVADNALQRTLDVVEQARACALLSRYFSSVPELIAAAQSAGLVLNAELIAKLLRIQSMPENILLGLMEGSIALPTAMRVGDYNDPVAMDAVVALLRELKISLSRQRELLDWIEAIRIRERINCTELLGEEPLAQWRTDSSLEAPRRTALILAYLKKRRYPVITRFEARYQQAVKKLTLAKGIAINPPPNFEGRTFSLKIEFSSISELLQHASEIGRLAQSPVFADLLDQNFLTNHDSQD